MSIFHPFSLNSRHRRSNQQVSSSCILQAGGYDGKAASGEIEGHFSRIDPRTKHHLCSLAQQNGEGAPPNFKHALLRAQPTNECHPLESGRRFSLALRIWKNCRPRRVRSEQTAPGQVLSFGVRAPRGARLRPVERSEFSWAAMGQDHPPIPRS